MFLVYEGKIELVIKDYTNISFQTNYDDLRSQSRFVFVLNDNVVGWKSFK
jgi:hypothetical protein